MVFEVQILLPETNSDCFHKRGSPTTFFSSPHEEAATALVAQGIANVACRWVWDLGLRADGTEANALCRRAHWAASAQVLATCGQASPVKHAATWSEKAPRIEDKALMCGPTTKLPKSIGSRLGSGLWDLRFRAAGFGVEACDSKSQSATWEHPNNFQGIQKVEFGIWSRIRFQIPGILH